jgi:hypothetical protein
MLNPRAVALQGIGFAATLVAVQGFSPVQDFVWDTTQGKAGAFNRTAYNRLLRDDELVTDLIVTLVTQGFFDGNAQNLFGGH